MKKQKDGFLSMLLGKSGASLLGNPVTGIDAFHAGKGIHKAGEGIVRAGEGNRDF